MKFRLLIGVLFIMACNNNSQKKDIPKARTTKEIIVSIENKFKAEQVENIKINKDTLSFVSVGWFYYYPLGKFDKIEDVQKDYPIFSLKIEDIKEENETNRLYRMIFKQSFIKLFYQPDTELMEIVSGKIQDKEIEFVDGIRVGVTKEKFLATLFNEKVDLKEIQVFRIYSALDGINHTYSFDKNILKTIFLDTDYMLPKD